MSNKSIKPKVVPTAYNSTTIYALDTLVTYTDNKTYRLEFNVRKSSGVLPDTGEWMSYDYPTYNSATSYKKYDFVRASDNVLYKLVNPLIYPGTQVDPAVDTTGIWEQNYPAAWSDQEYYTLGNEEYSSSIVTYNGSSVYIMTGMAATPELFPGNEFYNNWIPKPMTQSGLLVSYSESDHSLVLEWPQSEPTFSFNLYYKVVGYNVFNPIGEAFNSTETTSTDETYYYTYLIPSDSGINGTTSDIVIVGINKYGDESDYSDPPVRRDIPQITPPVLGPDPPIITAVINVDATITIHWIPPSTIGEAALIGYKITYYIDPINNGTINITNPNTTSYTLEIPTGMSGNGNIQAKNENNGFSDLDLGAFELLNPIESVSLIVSDLSSQQDLNDRSIKLNWSANEDYEYAIQYTISGYTEIIFHKIPFTEVTGNTVLGYTYNFNPNVAGSAIYNKPYNIKIYVCNSFSYEGGGIVYIIGTAGPSNLTSCFLPTQVPDKPSLETLPGNQIAILIFDFEIESVNNGERYIASEIDTFDGGSPILYYNIQCTNDNDLIFDISYNPILDINNNDRPFYIAKNLVNETVYEFRVQAINAIGPGEWSLYGTVTPDNPYQLTVTDISFNSMTFRWNYPDPLGYLISTIAVTNENDIIDLSSNVNSYTINNLPGGTEYFIALVSRSNISNGAYGMYGLTSPYTPNMSLPPGQSSYNILINGQIINFVPINSLASVSNGTQVLLNDTNYYSTPTLVNYVNTDISGETALISSSLVSVSKGIYNTLITTSETGTPVIQKGLLQILNDNDLTLTDVSSEIIVNFSSLASSPNRVGLVAFKNPSANELLNRIVGQFYFKLIDSTNGGSFVSSGFNLPFYYSSSNIRSTTETLNILRFNTSTYQFAANATLQNNLFSFNLTGNSSYIIQQQVPDPPTNVSVTQTGNFVYANFTAPTFIGSGPITSYVVTYTKSGTTKTVTGTTSPIMVPSLTIGESYTFTVKAVNSFGSSSGQPTPQSYTPIGSGTITGDPHITTIYGHSYFLPNINGRFLLFNNKNPEYNLYITTDCYFLNEQELESAAFTSKYLTDYTFMRTVNIKFRNQSIDINMNTLEVTGTTNNEIIIQQIISDKLTIGKFYSQNRRNELGKSLRFNGKSRKIKLIYKDIIYTIKVAVDLGCADHRNDINIDGPDMSSGYGAIISPNHILKITNL